jgi:hypothetical protein
MEVMIDSARRGESAARPMYTDTRYRVQGLRRADTAPRKTQYLQIDFRLMCAN